MKISRFIGFGSSLLLALQTATNAFAQTATDSASKGGTSEALPSAGTTQFTYILFMAGVILFVFGTLKLISSYRSD